MDILGKFECQRIVSSMLGLFRRCVIDAVFKATGKTPSVKDLLNRVARKGEMSSANCLRTEVGTGSAAQVLSGIVDGWRSLPHCSRQG